jgi:hypothetical protein
MNQFQRLIARVFRISDRAALEERQHLLQSWRSMLQTFLALERTIPAAPPEISLGIVEARGQIMRLKAQLRQWGVEIVDLADELLVADAPEVEHQLRLLATHRRNLEVLLQQEQHYGAHDAPLHVVNSISSTRGEIAQIKRRLRAWQAPVADQQNDEP